LGLTHNHSCPAESRCELIHPHPKIPNIPATL
jgi:hypothetical protein